MNKSINACKAASLEIKNWKEREKGEQMNTVTKLQYIMHHTLHLILTFPKARGEKKIED